MKVICHDAVEVLNSMIDDKSIDKFQIFFPDPWHKAKHHKRRIIQQAFVQLLLRKLKEDIRLRLCILLSVIKLVDIEKHYLIN